MIEEKNLRIEKVEMSDDGRYGKFVCEPLDRGYGITLGNSLRRILLSSLDGVAITSIKIDGVLHEFSVIDGIREDVTDIILNLKQLCFRMDRDAEIPMTVQIDVQKEGELKAGDLIPFMPPEVEILNPDLVIATLDDSAHLVMEMRLDRGKGYVPSKKNKKEDDMNGIIAIDSIFSPILRAKYEVSDVRVGNELDFDKLTLEVWTDGSISAAEAIAKSAAIMMEYLTHFKNIARAIEVPAVGLEPNEPPVGEPSTDGPESAREGFENNTIEELDLSVRAFNCLKRANIDTIADLLSKTVEDLEKVRNLGKKSIDEIEEKLSNHHRGPLYLKKKGE